MTDKHESSRERLIDATIETIYQHGYSDATVSKISDLARVPSATIHYYFTDKEDLLESTMRHLLGVMHKNIVDGCEQAISPRGKLWVVVQSVLGEEQSNERSASVWLSFWVHSQHNDAFRRLREIYKKRLYSNVRCYLAQIFEEIGAPGAADRAHNAASIIISLMHGVWISYALKEEMSDIEHSRLLVWECLEMLLSRARERLSEDEAVVATPGGGLLVDASLEVVASDVKNIGKWSPYAVPGCNIFIPHFRNRAYTENIRQANKIAEAGFTPIAHISARNIIDEDELSRIVAGMSGVGVRDFLLLGGGENPPVGQFDNSLQILQSEVLTAHRVRRVGFAGHPEAHPEQPRQVMREALLKKIACAQQRNMECFIATQFCFAATPFFDFLDWLKKEDISVPVRLGLAGRVNAAKLIKYAAACGIGRSLSFVRRQFGKSLGLVNYSPEGLLAELAGRIAVRRYNFPIGVHFYPFGAMRETLAIAIEASGEMAVEMAAVK